MSIWLLLIFLSHTVETVTKPFIVTQWPAEAEVTAGHDVILHCNIAELYSTCSTVVWLRVDAVNATISLTDRVQIDPYHSNTRNSICTAVIANLTVHDSGIYYCAAVQGRFAHIGNGTWIIVKEHITLPFIDILSPLIQNGPLIPLQCVVTEEAEDFQVHVSWAIGGRKEKGQSIRTHRLDGATQFTRNQILLTAEEWQRQVQCVCIVEFAGQLHTKTLQRHDASTVCYAMKYIYLLLCFLFGLLLLITMIAYIKRKRNYAMSCLGINI